MDRLKQLTEKLSRDYADYRTAALAATKESMFNRSYSHAICGEWQYFLELKYGPDEEGCRDDENDEGIEALLGLGNIFTELVEYSAGLDSFEFGISDYLQHTLDGFLELYRVRDGGREHVFRTPARTP